MRNYKAKDVDSYIASSAPEARPKLNELRKIIKSTVPNAEEGISWGVPFYKYHGLLVGFAAFSKHVTFGLVTVLQDTDRKILEGKGVHHREKNHTNKIRPKSADCKYTAAFENEGKNQ